jgi:hypothetical protein
MTTLDRTVRAAERPRVEKLRRELIGAIPRVPNNKASLQHMEQKNVADLMIDYLNWRSRYVGTRPRMVNVEPAALSDPRWLAKGAEIDAFLAEVRNGEDLTPHLSLKPRTRGYAPAARAKGASDEDRWSDKDYTLNTMGLHHFHLGTVIEPEGHASRTDELVFARVSRDRFDVIAIFDHSVFELESAERHRLWAVHAEVAFRDLPEGSFVLMGNIATSGHADHVVRYAQHCARQVHRLDPKLDDVEFVRGLYVPREEAPVKPKPTWGFLHLDLAVYDKAKPGFLIVEKAWD